MKLQKKRLGAAALAMVIYLGILTANTPLRIAAEETENAPLISRMNLEDAVVPADIVLTFPEDAAYRAAVTAVLVDGVPATVNSTVAGELAVDGAAFDLGAASEKIFTITVQATDYRDAVIRQPVYAAKKWSLTFSDEFDGVSLDSSKWKPQIGDGTEYGIKGWGNNEQQYYRAENATVGDGALTITAKKESYGESNYTSARLRTTTDSSSLFSQAYGKFEARMKLPEGQGMWPAFWMLPDSNTVYGNWPTSGEIDIMEAKGRILDSIGGALHYGNPGHMYISKDYELPDGGEISDYHIYGIEWEPTGIRWYVDDVLYLKTNNWVSQSASNPLAYSFPAPFDQPFHMLLNLAVGGNFDGNLEPDVDFTSAEMKVDYVRAYTSVAGYSEEDITPIKDDIPAGAKEPVGDDYIYDKNFNDIASIPVNPSGAWSFLTLPEFLGTATYSKDGSFLKTDISAVGNAAHAIQLVQGVPMVQGRSYELSFDAKASADRNIAVKVGDTGDNGWSVYGSFDGVKLTAQQQSYTYQFTMFGATDITSRVEFNLGLDAASVWIGNVSLKEIDSITIDYDAKKSILNDGNHIYNGGFHLGAKRLAYWHVDTGASVSKTTGELTVPVNTDVVQKGIQLLQTDTYKLTFDAKGGSVTAKLVSKNNDTVYSTETFVLTGSMMGYEHEFTMPAGATDEEAQVIFTAEGNPLTLGSVKMIRTTDNNQSFDGIDCYPLVNGDFENGKTGWMGFKQSTGYINSKDYITIEEDQEDNHYATINSTAGASPDNWFTQLFTEDGYNLTLYGGYDYNISFRAKATEAVTVTCVIEDPSYSQALSEPVALTTEWQTFDFSRKFSFSGEKGNMKIKFLLAAANKTFDFSLDDFVLEVKGAPKRPGSFALQNAATRVGEDVVLNWTGEQAWKDGASLLINGTPVDAGKVVKAADTVTLDKSLFAEAATYTVIIKADGYSDAQASITILPAGSNLITNGDFSHEMTGWESWINVDASLTPENGMLKMEQQVQATDNWLVQLWQDNLPVTPGETYVLSFDAYSTAARSISVEKKASEHIAFALTSEPETYTLEFVPDTATVKINFLLASITLSAPHSVYLDNVSLTRKETEPPAPPAGVNFIENGDFEDGKTGWTAYKAADNHAVSPDYITIGEEDGNHYAVLTSEASANPWDFAPMTDPASLKVYGDYPYTVSFRAKANKNVSVGIIMEDPADMTYRRFIDEQVSLTSEWQTFTFSPYQFDVTGEKDNLRVKFLLSDPDETFDFYLDDVVLMINVPDPDPEPEPEPQEPSPSSPSAPYIPPVQVKGDDGVVLEIRPAQLPSGVKPEDVHLAAKMQELTSAPATAVQSALTAASMPAAHNIAVYDMDLLLSSGEKVPFTGNIKVRIPLGDMGSHVRVFHLDDNGRMEEVYAVINGSFIEFEISHFSYYAAVDFVSNAGAFPLALAAATTEVPASTAEAPPANGAEQNPKTGAAAIPGALALLTLAGAVTFRSTKRR